MSNLDDKLKEILLDYRQYAEADHPPSDLIVTHGTITAIKQAFV